MKRSFLVMVALGLALGLIWAPAWGGDFYVIAGGGQSGKVLKTQVFTTNNSNSTLGANVWEKLSSPQWTYTKLSATSYLVITYQDSLQCTGTESKYQLRVNDLGSDAGDVPYLLVWAPFTTNRIVSGATGVWSGVPKGEVNLSIWHRQSNCTECIQNAGGGWGTSVIVMEIEN